MKRKLKDDIDASITAYVMIMIGMSFILYLFGFESLWTTYTTLTLGDNVSIADPSLSLGIGLLNRLVDMLTTTGGQIILGGGILAILGTVIFGWLTKSTSAILQYLIPIILFMALNIFVFPLGDLTTDLNAVGMGATTFLFVFFNAFYILSVLEFVRH